MSHWGRYRVDFPAGRWGCYPRVGAVPGQVEATATADAYTYGAFSEAMSTGQAMAAWADLQAKQNSPKFKGGSKGPPLCPTGFLLSLPNAQGLITCVNQRNVHIAVKYSADCDSSQHPGSQYESLWFECSQLPRWYELHHPIALNCYSTSVAEAAKLLPRAVRELGLLAPGRWNDVRSEVHALVRRMFRRYDAGRGDCNIDRTEESVENELVNVIAPVYDAAVKRGGDVPQWVEDQVGVPSPRSSAIAQAAVVGALGIGVLYLAKPALVTGAVKGGAMAIARKVSGAL